MSGKLLPVWADFGILIDQWLPADDPLKTVRYLQLLKYITYYLASWNIIF